MAIGAQRSCCGSNKLFLWNLSGGSAESGCTLPEHQWDADNNAVSLTVQDPASGLFYWITVCLEKAKTVSLFSCKVSASLCWFCEKSACFGRAVAKVEQDARQGWKAACPGEQSWHSSWNPLGLAVMGWAAQPRLCSLCACHKPATVALWDLRVGAPEGGKHTQTFQASEWTWLHVWN